MDRSLETRIVGRAFRKRPTVVRSGEPAIDFLDLVAADVVDEHLAVARAHGERERIAKSQRPDGAILAVRLLDKRIIAGDRSVRIDSQQLPLERAEILRGVARRLFADRDVELAVGAEVQRASLMPGG